MREYTITYKDGLIRGLRKSSNNPRNYGSLLRADGIVKEAGELEALPVLEALDVSTIAVTGSFPFPQVFQGRNWTLVCTPTEIYTYDGVSFTLVYTSAEGSTWTVADFFDFLVLTNGLELITLNPETGNWSKYLECSIPYCLCITDVNGQLFCGGPEASVSAGWLGE